jgi:ATP-dependent Lon protease
MPSAQRLPVLPLPHPLLLLPTARLTIPVSRPLADNLLAILEDSDAGQPVLAAVPVPLPLEPGVDALPPAVIINAPPPTYGVAARVVRLVRARTVNSHAPRYPYLLYLHGLTRIRLLQPLALDPSTLDSLPQHAVAYPPADTIPSRETFEAFKDAALRLLDRLAKDSVQAQRKDEWLKVASMVEEISDQRAAWMADVLVAAISGQYADKFGQSESSSVFSFFFSSTSQTSIREIDFLAATEVEDRLRRATELFIKQQSISEVSKKIANAVDESLSRQQKEYFLRQQLAAIQRELHSLHNMTPGPGQIGSPSGTGFGTGHSSSELDEDEQADADDLADLRKKIEALDAGSEERKVGVREWRRLKRIPQGSVENGVIRTYVRRCCA